MVSKKQPNDGEIIGLWGKAQQAGLTRRKFLALLAAGGVTAVLASCTKSIPSTLPTTPSTVAPPVSTTKPATSTTPAAPSTTAKPTTTSTPIAPPSPTINKYGGTLRINWSNDVTQFGYPLNFTGPAHNYGKPCLEGLFQSSNQLSVPKPLLATSWELAPDKKYYTFKLRQGVKFHDGTDFNAAAAKSTLDQVLAKRPITMPNVTSIEIIDDYTIKGNLKDWDVFTLNSFGSPYCFMYSPTALAKNGVAWADTNPVGTGPFTFQEWQRGQYYKFKRNANYWDKSLPYLDGIVINYIKDPATAKISMLKGDLDLIRGVDADTANECMATGKFAEEHLPTGKFILAFDSTYSTSIWTDKRLREALEYGIDKEYITNGLGRGFSVPAYDIIFGIRDLGDPGTTPRKYDPVKAKQLLADAGYASGLRINVKLGSSFANPPYITAIQYALRDIGINVEIISVPDATWQAEVLKLPLSNEVRYERQLGGLPIMSLYNNLTNTSVNFPGIRRPDGWDGMVANLIKEPDPAKQTTLLLEMEKLAYTNAMFVPLWTVAEINLFVSNLQSDLSPRFFSAQQTDWINLKYLYYAK